MIKDFLKKEITFTTPSFIKRMKERFEKKADGKVVETKSPIEALSAHIHSAKERVQSTTFREYDKKERRTDRSLLFCRFSTREQTHFVKRLSFLNKAGVPLLESMHILKEQTNSSLKAKVFQYIIDDISNGKYLHVSLGKFRRFFGDFAVNIIRVGEMGGSLSDNLNYLADELRKKELLKQKIIGALIYPIFISIVTIVLTALLTVFIFPKIMPIFQSLDVTLPVTTLILLAISLFLKDFGLYLVVGIILFVIAFIVSYKKVEPFRVMIDVVVFRIPLIGGIARAFQLANFTRTTGLLLSSGLSIVDAISITGDTIENRIYRKASKELSEAVRRGEPMSKYLKEHRKLFPDMIPHMVAIGERSGNLSTTLLYLSELYENEVDDKTKNLSNAIEPILMIFMGLMVGFVAVSVITPIYSLTQNLSR